jgi:subtilase family serine protease
MIEDRVLLSAVPAAPESILLATRPAPYVAPNTSTSTSTPGEAHTFLYQLNNQGSLSLTAGGAVPSSDPATGQPLGPYPSSLTPAQTRHIYSIDAIKNLGDGQTIAIVDAYDDPNVFSDADTFDRQFNTTLGGTTSYYSAYGAASTWLTKAYATSKPRGNTGWGQEISLDVQWAHAIAPKAKILLVEARTASYNDLLAGDDYAVSHGATVISNSWGSGEFSGENSYDSHFNKSGVTFVFSAGDSGNQSYPAESPYVVAVGGTTLSHDSNYNWTGESGWSAGGGGVSGYEGVPPYQSSLGRGYTGRANPDVAYDADPNSGFAVYDSYGGYGWGQYGGTSAGAPQWSAIIALANQGRSKPLDGYSQTLPDLYAMTSGTTGMEALNDVQSGSNGVGSAGPGFDLVTGKGTPRRSDLVYSYLTTH